MFEKFLGKSKTEKERGPERVIKLGTEVLQKEASAEIKPWRSGGYMLCTVLAMALAMGMTAGKAEAQVRGIGPQSWGGGRQFASEVFHRGVFEIGSSLDRTQNAKQDRVEHEYVARLTQLGDAVRQLDNQYANQKARLMRRGGSPEDLKNLENSYLAEKTQLIRARIELEKEYRRQTRNNRIKKGLTEALIQGVRGW